MTDIDTQIRDRIVGQALPREVPGKPGAGVNRPVPEAGVVVHLSDQSQSLYLAREAVAALTDIESSRVDNIKQNVQTNRYSVNVDQVAEKIIRQAIRA